MELNEGIESKQIEYDSENAKRILRLLEKNPRGMTITEISNSLNLNRHTVTKILERLLIEKRVDFDERGPAKVFYFVGKSQFIGKIEQGKDNILWIDLFKPVYEGEEEFVRINQTKKDTLIRSKNKYRSIGSVAIKKSKIKELISILEKLI
ncbi:MAG: winged helix-turn-helix transcriptional regulator [Candidatus Aenigmatarchaeota archaeon]|nr:MarR family transcriptional regulator [Candidatus Aenigmarchaeota archaeon]